MLDSELDKCLVRETEVGQDLSEVSCRWIEEEEEEEKVKEEGTGEDIMILTQTTMMDTELIDQTREATNLTRTVTATTATIDPRVMQLPRHLLITINLLREQHILSPMVILRLHLLPTTIPLLHLTKVEEP